MYNFLFLCIYIYFYALLCIFIIIRCIRSVFFLLTIVGNSITIKEVIVKELLFYGTGSYFGECFSECDLFFATLFFILFFADALWDGGSFYCLGSLMGLPVQQLFRLGAR